MYWVLVPLLLCFTAAVYGITSYWVLVSTHNPVTWQAYSNYDAAQDHPQHRSRYEGHANAKAGQTLPPPLRVECDE